MRKLLSLGLLALCGCQQSSPAESPSSPPRGDAIATEMQPGTMGLLFDERPEEDEVLIYNKNIEGLGFDTVPVGTSVKYLGPAPQDRETHQPMVRIVIQEGDYKGVICTAHRKFFRVAP